MAVFPVQVWVRAAPRGAVDLLGGAAAAAQGRALLRAAFSHTEGCHAADVEAWGHWQQAAVGVAACLRIPVECWLSYDWYIFADFTTKVCIIVTELKRQT